MDALAQLRSACARDRSRESEDLTRSAEIDRVLRELEARVKGAGSQKVPIDLQQEAVQRFWRSKRLDSWKEGRLVSFGLCLPIAQGGVSVLDDRPRFSALLDGVNQWVNEPKRYRRCYQGLLVNYFGYDAESPRASASGQKNWITLRSYLEENVSHIRDNSVNPSWVTTITNNRRLLGDNPCEFYGAALLKGHKQEVAEIRSDLLIDDSSWFVRELVMAQIGAAVLLSNESFVQALSRVLDLLSSNAVLRDRGMVMLLNRYAGIPSTPPHRELSDRAVQWWGNPWLTSNTARWGAVAPSARKMVADWLKNEFVEAFFSLLAEEGAGDRRRMEFWKRYLPAIDDMYFVLGADARQERGRDFIDLLKKMEGRTMSLVGTVSSANAFVMTLGDVVVVEFSGSANALYGYDRRRPLPFPLVPGAQLGSAKDGPNSLKSSSRQLWLKHADGIHGWERWEQMFEATLRKEFKIEPSATVKAAPRPRVSPVRPAVTPRTYSATTPSRTEAVWTVEAAYSLPRLLALAADHGFEVEDKTHIGGNLWVRSAVSPDVARALSAWGFRFKVGKGWWK